MFVKKLQFHNFKRFSDLTIDLSELPKPPKLVLMIGSNGSGKSSLFDGFEMASSFLKRDSSHIQPNYKSYFQKTGTQGQNSPTEMIIVDALGNEFNITDVIHTASDTVIDNLQNAFYGRSSLRQTPRLTRTSFGQNKFDFEKDSDRPKFYIDKDDRFENDIEHTVKVLLDDFFKRNASGSDEIIRKFITTINNAFKNIFQEGKPTSLEFYAFSPPIEGVTAEIIFKKGTSVIHYDLLSSGEKEVLNILLNLLNRRSLYQDTIYFFDELDLHLNTALQYNLLKEITENWIPENCQLWTASHSLGFIDYANESDLAVVIDFDDLDFDNPQVLYPQPKEHLEVFEVAVPRETLLRIFKGQKIIYCENQNDEYYQLLGFEKKIFVGVRDAGEVFLLTKNQPIFYGLRDRDYLTDVEIKKIQKDFPNLYILNYYSFESYLYHPDNIQEISPTGFDYQTYKDDILEQKNQKQLSIIINLKESRKNYKELGEAGIDFREKEEVIAERLSSQDFEVFYPFFDMKKMFNKCYLEKFGLSAEKLVRTNWFKNQIGNILQ
ncbi:MAG: AAA family ATPase [Arcicella sp.]|nr:AAA family ATPase [Arcicella sp.]